MKFFRFIINKNKFKGGENKYKYADELKKGETMKDCRVIRPPEFDQKPLG